MARTCPQLISSFWKIHPILGQIDAPQSFEMTSDFHSISGTQRPQRHSMNLSANCFLQKVPGVMLCSFRTIQSAIL